MASHRSEHGFWLFSAVASGAAAGDGAAAGEDMWDEFAEKAKQEEEQLQKQKEEEEQVTGARLHVQ